MRSSTTNSLHGATDGERTPELYVNNKRNKSSEGEGGGRSKRKKVQEQASGDGRVEEQASGGRVEEQASGGRVGEAENCDYCEYCDYAEDHGTSRHVKYLPPKLADYVGRILEEGRRTRRNPRTGRYNQLPFSQQEEGNGNERALGGANNRKVVKPSTLATMVSMHAQASEMQASEIRQVEKWLQQESARLWSMKSYAKPGALVCREQQLAEIEERIGDDMRRRRSQDAREKERKVRESCVQVTLALQQRQKKAIKIVERLHPQLQKVPLNWNAYNVDQENASRRESLMRLRSLQTTGHMV